MQSRKTAGFGAAILGSLLSTFAWGQAPPPPPPAPTLWSFLGIPQAAYKINAQLLNRRGNFPGLEMKPPLKGIADPANLKSDVPAIKAAAEIKAAEDLKPQKIKAIKYLATIGCGCYDKDEKITKALLAAMDDCTEEVRLEAMRAVQLAAAGGQCNHCGQRSCCNEKIVNQLYKIAYEMDDLGCHIEPSERVREAAIEAMQVCCPHRLPADVAPEPTPVEGGAQPTPIEGGTPATPPAPAPAPAAAAGESRAALVEPKPILHDAALERTAPAAAPVSPPSSRRTSRTHTVSQQTSVSSAKPVKATIADQAAEAAQPEASSPVGYLTLFDTRRKVAHVHFPRSDFQPRVGDHLQVMLPGYHEDVAVGELEVVQTAPGSVNVRPVGDLDVIRIGRQARVVPMVR